jgi:hypothetical protein
VSFKRYRNEAAGGEGFWGFFCGSGWRWRWMRVPRCQNRWLLLSKGLFVSSASNCGVHARRGTPWRRPRLCSVANEPTSSTNMNMKMGSTAVHSRARAAPPQPQKKSHDKICPRNRNCPRLPTRRAIFQQTLDDPREKVATPGGNSGHTLSTGPRFIGNPKRMNV